MLSFLGNIIWLVFGGLEMGLAWWLAALLCFLSILGIPFGIVALRIGSFTFWPFGRRIADRPSSEAGAAFSLVGNILWILFCGWWLAIGHLTSALACFVTIIGIPFGWQHLKLAALSLLPFGKQIVPIAAGSRTAV